MHGIQKFALTRFDVDLDRIIGDSQVSTACLSLGVLELEDDDGNVGTGFFHSVTEPLPSLGALQERFHRELGEQIIGASPFAWVNRLARPRGGRIRTSVFSPSVEQAMWDLQGQILGLPLYRLLGGEQRKVRAYASGLEFHLTDEQVVEFYASARRSGFSAFKVKVGHPDLAWDLRRLKLVQDTVGHDCVLMADANEAWAPKEAIRRLHAFHDAGVSLYWIEDPCLRDDFDGLRSISQAVPHVLVNAGEYLDLSGKRRLIEERAVDVLNVHASISEALKLAWLAGEHGLPVAVGNTNFEIGVHIAAALPEVTWLEYSFLSYNHLLETPIEFCDGYAVAPDRPGHGLRLAESARGEFGTSR
ncbi:MAG TPA: mandelate racemase/muconate lactonizing enzyme family protein [Ilumatobacteraceae bacterium]|jgi:L-alanine-DL-glutamate epimerase-like enolase superfamily enzyme|nr:mandelate racemase/muconate lactonizing enzyme family protein [Ilumatobacteraceae bacterium]